MKKPKYLMEPPVGWVDPHGLDRAAKAASIQASYLRKEGRLDAALAVAEFSCALKAAAAKDGFRVAEGISLGW